MSVRLPTSVAFDCDMTLIECGNYDTEHTVRHEVVNMFKAFQMLGCDMYIWSAGGVEWAEKVRKMCGLTAKVIEKPSNRELFQLHKSDWKFCPDIAVDDCEDVGKVTIFV